MKLLPFALSIRKPLVPILLGVTTLAVLAATLFSPLIASVFAATPTIGSITTTNLQATSVTISWTTDVVSDTQISYGTTTAYGSNTPLVGTLVTNHSQTITGLAPNQLYHFQVKSKDALGDLAVSSDRTFITPLGTTTPGGSTDSSNSNTINTTRFTTATGGQVASLSVYVGAVDASVSNRNYQLAIYAANGSVPGALVANTATGTLVGNTWNTLPVSATLAPATSYFIAYNTNGTSSSVNNMRYTNGGTSGWSTGGQAFGTWPASFGAFSPQSATFSLYATFVSDVTPPQVSITAPTDGAPVSGTVTVAADASDDNNISGVQFKLGDTNLGPQDTVAPYTASWDTTTLLDGPTQTITAIATDSAGNVTTSSPVNVTTNNPPKVSINQPTSGQSIAATTVTVTYTRTGDWSGGKHTHFRLDGGPTKMDFNADLNQSYTFIDVPGGNHTLEAIVADGSHVEMPGTGGTVSFSTIAPDITPPTVAITAPADSATVQNTVSVTANATDETAVVGVQFLLDGANLGSEDTTAPYSTSWNTTTATNGSHTLTARARDSLNQTTSTAVTVNVQNTDPRAVTGEWSSVSNWPLVAVHASLMHTGEILMWDAWESPTSNAKLWNPATNIFTNVPVSGGLFCSGHATNADGHLVVMGGHSGGEAGIKLVTTFDPVSKTWTRNRDMQYARWYPSVTQMPDNRMVTFSGQITSGNFANTPEVYNPKTNTLNTLPFTTPQLREIQYPQTSVLSSGKILAISTEQGSVMTYRPSDNEWANLGTTQVPYGVWTSFAPNKYLITGGGTSFNSYSPSNPGPSQKTTRILDMSTGTPAWSNGGDMNNGRSFHNVTMLPNGKALAIGGSTTVNDFSTTGTQTAEEWDPTTNTWTQLASPARPRMYHSVSILLPDGRVLSAGGGRLAPAPDQLNAQIYSPSYMFRGARPTITSAPNTIGHNSTMDVVSPNASDISKVTFVNLASVTHTADWNQRFMELPFTRNGDTLTVNTPANANFAPENYYMVFLVNADGVPSEAKIVKLGVPDTTAPVISDVTATNVAGTSATVNWTTDELTDTQVEYGLTTSYGSQTTLNANLSTTHTQNLTGLAADTTYHYRVKSKDGSGNLTTSGDFTFTTAPIDTQPPSVDLTAPGSGATVSGSITVSANATDNVGVAGVQFRLNGANLGSEDTSSPYSTSWNTTQVANGTHTLSAIARDAAGNTTTATSLTVTVNNAVASGGLVAAYSFNENSGTIITDTSGNGNNGTLSQATWYASGKFGSALSFNGTSAYASVPDSSSLDLTNRMTLQAWVRPTASSGWRTVMLKENSSELIYGMYARESSNKPSGWIRTTTTTGSSLSAGATPSLPLNAWSHMTTTYDGSNLRLYINGTLRATRAVTGNMPVSSNPLKFGGNAIWGEYFAGQLDNIRIYNRALTAAEIQTDMNIGL